MIDVRLDGCATLSDSDTTVKGTVALNVENASDGRHHLILKKVPENLDLATLLQGDVAASEDVVDVTFIGEASAGQSINVAFTEALGAGSYALFCYPQGSTAAEGIVATSTVR